ncbi:hypothetical protein ACQP2H_11505 [Micromonospora sp. CA-248260]|uniref:hypothetical protein n=1 Tax=Micromonospora sp. CA-248260 TaxID=3239962 RepID=UPI003D93CE7F
MLEVVVQVPVPVNPSPSPVGVPSTSPVGVPYPSPTGVINSEHFGADFWERFLTSAGFGGVMAVVAALVAASIAMMQFRHVKRQHHEERWWETLTWVYDRTIVEEGRKPPLPQRVTLAMLTALSERVGQGKSDRLRGEAISSILTIFDSVAIDATRGGQTQGEDGVGSDEGIRSHPQGEEGIDQSIQEAAEDAPNQGKDDGVLGPVENAWTAAAIAVTDPKAAAMLRNLRVSLNEKGFSSDVASAAYAYEMSVYSVLRRAAISVGAVISQSSQDYGFDYLITRGGIAVAVTVNYSQFPIIGNLSHLLSAIPRVGFGRARLRYLLVTNHTLSREVVRRMEENAISRKLRFVTWAIARDSPRLEAVLFEMLEVEKLDRNRDLE